MQAVSEWFFARMLNSAAPHRSKIMMRLSLGAWLCFILLAGLHSASAQVNVYTRSYDTARTGANLNETILTPANVSATSFGKLFSVPTDGQVYAQPLYVSNLSIAGGKHNVVFVATMLNTIYAIDGDSGAVLWSKNFGTPITPSEVEGDQNISWNTGIGILSTPVIDPSTNYMYFVSANEHVTNGANVYENHLNAIDITTGQPVLGSPMNITGTYQTADLINPMVFNAKIQNQRPSLLLSNGNVYIAWASHEDQFNYHGWVMAYSASTLQQVATYSDTTTGNSGGIWQAGSGLTADHYGNIYISTGNGSFGKTTNGLMQTGNSFVKLSPTLQLLDYFTPFNSANLNSGDQDLGASGLLLIPNTNYVLGGGKQGVFYLSDTVNGMGGFNSSADQVRQEFQAIYGKGTSHIHGTPTYYDSGLNGPTIYVWGENDFLRAYLFNPTTGMLNTTPLGTSTMTAPVTNNYGAMPGGFTSISANGNTNGIVWAATPFDGDAVHGPVTGTVYAFNADTMQLLWSDRTKSSRDAVGIFSKYCPPMVANGKMYIPNWGPQFPSTGIGGLVVYGLLPKLTVTPNNVSIATGAAIPTLTGTVAGLVHGDTLGSTIQVAYSTTATSNSAAGTYPITATITGSSAINYNIVVNAGTLTISSGLQNTGFGSGAISFNGGFAGSNVSMSGSAQISGAKLRLTTSGSTYQAASAFYPTPLNVQSFTNDFTFQLTTAVGDGFAMVIQNSSPNALGANGGMLGYGPSTQAGIAKSVAVKFDLYDNSGEGTDSTGIYLNGASPTVPAFPLASTGVNLASGHIFHAHAAYDGAVLNVTITDTVTGASSILSYAVDIPGTVGAQTAYIGFTAGTGAATATQDILSWVYSPEPAYASGFSSAQLTLNGGAALSGTKLRIVDGGTYEARSGFFTTPVNVQSFKASFSFQITNPTGDGLAIVFQGVSPTAVGGYGGSLGYGPIGTATAGIPNSVAVKFDLYSNNGEGGDSTGMYQNGASPTTPFVDLTNTGIDLHSGHVFLAALGYDGTTLTVTIKDTTTQASATQSYTVNIPNNVGSPTAYVGFTGGTGLYTSTADVQSWSYLAGPTIKPHLVYPTMGLSSSSSGPTFRVFQWTGFADDNGTVLDATKVGDNVTLTVNVPTTGSYDISFNSKAFTTRGMAQLTVDGTAVGGAFDQYNSNTNGVFQAYDLGKVTLSAGKHLFKFTVTGKNAQSSGVSLAFGQIILTAQ